MLKYCESIHKTKRWKTREVLVGHLGVGGDNPIRIQSMTTSNTRDVQATIEQIMRLSDAGCEIARITVQGMKEADACEAIKNGLLQRGYTIPLVADIHFFPPAAMRVIDFVDKVRINPGNYIDKRASFKTIEYDDMSYAQEIDKIEEKFTPLIEKCRRLKRSMRIGTNHGSLSDRIMNRYGDTPRGMLESALEFARICRKNDYHDFIFSMKSSNPQVMILAYRLLVAEMMALGWDYPLHLGVTEAGEGEDGRIKSAMGIGSLLLDGIGDTIRVSLTEDAWNEIDPCRRLLNVAKSYESYNMAAFEEKHRNIEAIERRNSVLPKDMPLHPGGAVILSANIQDVESSNFYKKIGCDLQDGEVKRTSSSLDGLIYQADIATTMQNLQAAGIVVFSPRHREHSSTSIFSLHEAIGFYSKKQMMSRFNLATEPKESVALCIKDEPASEWSSIEVIKPSLIFLSPSSNRLHYARHFFDWLKDRQLTIPVILAFHYECSKEDLIIQAAAEYGALFCDGLGDGMWIQGPYDIEFLRNLSFNILQAARMRSSKTEFISCPSCGRTLFDLQAVSKRIRAKTAHLPGVKIAIMGCIVNGPGEMADADFGYVGSKPGMIDLYVGKQCVAKDIAFSDADTRLIELIKQHGRWVEPNIVNPESADSAIIQ